LSRRQFSAVVNPVTRKMFTVLVDFSFAVNWGTNVLVNCGRKLGEVSIVGGPWKWGMKMCWRRYECIRLSAGNAMVSVCIWDMLFERHIFVCYSPNQAVFCIFCLLYVCIACCGQGCWVLVFRGTPTPGLENLGLQTPTPVLKNLDSNSGPKSYSDCRTYRVT